MIGSTDAAAEAGNTQLPFIEVRKFHAICRRRRCRGIAALAGASDPDAVGGIGNYYHRVCNLYRYPRMDSAGNQISTDTSIRPSLRSTPTVEMRWMLGYAIKLLTQPTSCISARSRRHGGLRYRDRLSEGLPMRYASSA